MNPKSDTIKPVVNPARDDGKTEKREESPGEAIRGGKIPKLPGGNGDATGRPR